MMKTLLRFFGEKGSGETARRRMQVALMHDRLDLAPAILESLERDIMKILKRYMEIDHDSIRVDLEKGKEYTALVVDVHVKRVLRRGEITWTAQISEESTG